MVTVGETEPGGKIIVVVSLKLILVLAALNKLERKLTTAIVCKVISSRFHPVPPT